jgi:hypothetical protein
VIDLTTHLPHTHDDTVDDLLSRHIEQLLPTRYQYSPRPTRSNTASRASARRPTPAMRPIPTPGQTRTGHAGRSPPTRCACGSPHHPARSDYATPAMHGWTALRRIWPQLPTDPASTHPTARDTR